MIYDYQRTIYEKLLLTAKAKRLHQKMPPQSVSPRLHRLIIGPSGTGKTHIARQVGDELGWPVLTINVSAWMILGCRETPTWNRIAEFYKENDSSKNFLIILDELDKVWGMDSWTRYLRVEIFSLMDGMLPVGVSDDISPRFIQKCLKNTLVMGCGAFQDAFDEKPSLGFNPQDAAPKSSHDLAKHIPREVVNRFDSEILVMPDLKRSDYEKMLEEMISEMPECLEPYFREFGPPQIDAALRDKSCARWAENLYASALYYIAPDITLPPDEPEPELPEPTTLEAPEHVP